MSTSLIKDFPVAVPVTITPEIATQMLHKNIKNRPLKRQHLAFLCEQLRKGQWKFNGDPIRFASDNTLIDGQHRLEAVRQTGISITTLVISNLDQSVYDTIDTGALRSSSDVLTVAGEKNTRALGAALIVVDELLSGKTSFVRSTKYSNTDILRVLEQHQGIRNSLPWKDKLVRFVPGSISVAMHYIFSRSAPEKADQFFYAIATGENLEVHDPAYVLRQRLIENATSKGKLTRRYITALFVKAWNSWKAGTKIKALRFRETGERPEEFPNIK